MNWRRTTDRNFNGVFDFLIKNETASIAVFNRMMRPDKAKETWWVPPRRNGILLSMEYQGKVIAAALISRNGLLLPVFGDAPSAFAAETLVREIRALRQPLTTVMGMKKHVDMLARNIGDAVGARVDYYYMLNRYPDIIKAQIEKDSIFRSDDGLKIRLAGEKDCDRLFELHREYELEEVLLDKSTFRPDFSYMYLKQILRNEIVYMLELDGQAIAKCNSNARSPGFLQIGGMFTKKEFRNKKYKSLILNSLMLHTADLKKHSALFVKKDNKTAIRLYEKTGFSGIDEYTIIYC